MAEFGPAGQHPEGRFFPDTYHFAAGTPDRRIYQLAYERMSVEAAKAWENRADGLPLRNADEVLTRGYSEQAIWFIGWANHHLALFRPPQPKEIVDGVPQNVPLDEVRLEVAKGCVSSFGDCADLVAAGAWSLETALEATRRRAAAIGATTVKGGMIAVSAGKEKVEAALKKSPAPLAVEIANENAIEQVVLAGPLQGLDAVEAHLGKEGLEARRLEVPGPGHGTH